MPCKLDGILHFKSNSYPQAVYLPGFLLVPGTSVSFVGHSYPYPELLQVLYASATNTQGTGKAFSYLPGTSVSSVRPCHNTWNFCNFCNTFIPVPGTSVSAVRPVHNTRGTGTACFVPARNFCELCSTSLPVSETSGSSVRLPHLYPESTNPTEHDLRTFCWKILFKTFFFVENKKHTHKRKSPEWLLPQL